MVSQIAQDSFRYTFVLAVMRGVLKAFPNLNRQSQEELLEYIYNDFEYLHYSSENTAIEEICEDISAGRLLTNANTITQ